MEEEKKEQKTHGGARPGAGRPKGSGKNLQILSIRMKKDYVTVIRANYDNLSAFVDKAVKNQLIRERLI